MERQSILVGLAKICAVLAPIMQFYFYRIDRESNRCKMVKGTCLATLQGKSGTPRRLGPGSPRRMTSAHCYLMRCKHKQSINKMQQTYVNRMHRMKEGVIPRVLTKESLNLELRLQRYDQKKFRDLFLIFGILHKEI
jgi:hypothetical protein